MDVTRQGDKGRRRRNLLVIRAALEAVPVEDPLAGTRPFGEVLAEAIEYSRPGRHYATARNDFGVPADLAEAHRFITRQLSFLDLHNRPPVL